MIEYTVNEYNCGFPFITVDGCNAFDAESIFECGQCFRWMPVKMNRSLIEETLIKDGKFSGDCGKLPGEGLQGYLTTAKGRCVKVFSENNKIWILNTCKKDWYDIWYDYFDMARDYSSVKHELSLIDGNMKKAVEMTPGLRILKQEFFETLISFIVSANNNIPRIKKIIGNLSEMCGKKIDVPESFRQEAEESNMIYGFPGAAELSKYNESEISEKTHAGYRCPYIVNTSAFFSSDPFSESEASGLTYEEAFRKVSKYMGVGPKVADCILLFTGAKDEAFPVDVWVRRVMETLYPECAGSVNKIREFGRNYFGRYAGIAQEYLFIMVRSMKTE